MLRPARNFNLRPGILALGLTVAACTENRVLEPAIENLRFGPFSVSVAVPIPIPAAPPSAAQLVIPASVASLRLEVRSPECPDGVAYSEVQNPAAGQEEVVFTFDLTATEPTACFLVRAHSDPDGQGTLVFEGSTSGVDLTSGEGLNVQVELGLVGTTPPMVITLPATNLGSASATLAGTVNPRGFPSLGYFEWGLTDSYGSRTPPTFVGSGTGEVSISQVITGLVPGQTYHFRAVGRSSGNVVLGEDMSFTTGAASADVVVDFPEISPPTVATQAATAVGLSGAVLNAAVNPEGTETSLYFEWGLDTNYGNATGFQDLGAGTTDTPAQADLTGLAEGVQYHFRAVAFNAGGLTVGEDRAFVTAGSILEALVQHVETHLTSESLQQAWNGAVTGEVLVGSVSGFDYELTLGAVSVGSLVTQVSAPQQDGFSLEASAVDVTIEADLSVVLLGDAQIVIHIDQADYSVDLSWVVDGSSVTISMENGSASLSGIDITGGAVLGAILGALASITESFLTPALWEATLGLFEDVIATWEFQAS
jgi:hypothetical protein